MLIKKNRERPKVIIPTVDLNLSSSHLSLKLNFFMSRSRSDFFFFLSAAFDFVSLEPLRTLRTGFLGLDDSELKSGIFMLRSKTKRLANTK